MGRFLKNTKISSNFKIKELLVSPQRRTAVVAEAKSLKSLTISTVELQWLQVLSEGWAHPLKGFMREQEFLQVLHFNCLIAEDGSRVNHSVPIVLSLSEEDKKRLEDVSAFTLSYDGKAVAILRNPEFYYQRKEERCSRQFGTSNPDHPYIKVSEFKFKFENLTENDEIIS
jgi:3'-phosphoadenosine 5'-phosphosulfate synthase